MQKRTRSDFGNPDRLQYRKQGETRYNRDENRCRPYSNKEHQSSRKYPQRGYKLLQELLKNEDLEDVLLQLNNDRKGFRLLLESKEISNDVTVLIVKLLCKISNSNFEHNKVLVLEAALQSNFSDNIINYIARLAVQDAKEKTMNSCFWNNPDEFWNSIINMARNVNDVIPTSSCEVMLKILNTIVLYLPLIEKTHSIHISDEIKTNVENLRNVIGKVAQDVERKCDQGIVPRQSELEPPDDFRKIDIYPSAAEVSLPNKPFLRPNVIDKPYQSVDHYLDVQFRLLREDFVRPLRIGICKYINDPKAKLENIKIHKQIQFLNMEIVNEQNCYRIQYNFNKKKRQYKYENSKRFMFGSLLCLTSDNFYSVLFAKVVERDIKDLEKGQLIVGFNNDIILPTNLYDQRFLMVESNVYFEPYYHVLNVLKKMQTKNFPMEKYIIRVETDLRPPQYLNKFKLDCGDNIFYGFNNSQNLAFKAALTQEFSVIQGPPGTGKTFLGLKIARTLLRNINVWYKDTPMLVICFTNHALDQFLEGLLEMTDLIVRVGGQSKNEKLKNFNIRSRNKFSNDAIFQMRRKVQSSIQEIKLINENLNQIEANDGIEDFVAFLDVVPNYKDSYFYKASDIFIITWLFAGYDRRYENVREMPRNDKTQQASTDCINLNLNQTTELQEREEGEVREEDELMDDVFQGITVTGCKQLVSLKSLNDDVEILEKKINDVLTDNQMSYLKRYNEKCLLNRELDRTRAEIKYLKRRLHEFKDNFPKQEPLHVDLSNPENMDPHSRWHWYFYWLGKYAERLREKREHLIREFRKIFKAFNEMREMGDVLMMKRTRVVGMTTTGAARLQSSLQALKSPIVIVEEAAEVFEAHIISSLTAHCKHLILIGDHQQLKPSTANFQIETKFLLGISLFERMVLNKIQCFTLNIQHRMRPEISCLIRPAIYPVLEDHESVKYRLPIHGIEKCVYFIDHQECEQRCNDNSKKNTHEAKFLIQLARYLVLNNYKPQNITILVAYLGQMYEMQSEKKQYKLLLQNVRIAVLDNYQGEENDIILLSLVRNNDEKKIGFLKIENRVCVALSRARNGLYMMGNMAHLCESSELWPKIKKSLEDQDAVGPDLTLCCQVHRHKITRVRTADDFLKIPEGGCDLKCEAELACGHICTRLCHIEDREHAQYRCRQKCERLLCEDPLHVYMKECHEKWDSCTYKVIRDLQCGHSVMLECYIQPETYNCTVPVMTKLTCGHETEKPCSSDPETFACPHPCETRVEPCGHACKLNCHTRNDPDHLKYQCLKPCGKYRIGCSLKKDENPSTAHICPNICNEKCVECDIKVWKKRTVCPHIYEIACNLNVDEMKCIKPCTKNLPCGHKCKMLCWEPCGNCSVFVDKVVADCNHKVKIRCSQEPNRKYCRGKCPRLLPCGHVCVKKCYQDCTTDCQVKVDCSIPGPCGHTLTRIKCYLRNTVDPNVLLKSCTEKCNVKLKCDHPCGGSCGECFQGRIHARCKEKCGVTLICNHECPIPCRQACKPCQKNCDYHCGHSRCSKKCGDPCTKCVETCKRRCRHQECRRKCMERCNVPPCTKLCRQLLKCGHPCVGFCGDPCPILCRICNKKQLTEIFLGNEDEKDAIYVMLVDCKHIFESTDLEQWLVLDADQIKAKVCPRCKTTIKKTHRYSEFIKSSMKDIMKVKLKSYGSSRENDENRKALMQDLTNLEEKSKNISACAELQSSLRRINERLQVSRKRDYQERRQNINRMDLIAIKSKIQVIEIIVETFEKQKISSKVTDKCTQQLEFILSALMRQEDSVTNQEIEDINLEIDRLLRYVQFKKIRESDTFSFASANPKVGSKVVEIEQLLEGKSRYSKEQDDLLQKELEELSKISSSEIIAAVEKKQIVTALGLQPGHWFKCSNGHPYIITECGGAMMESRCNECGVKIGGQNHRLLHGSHAPEMDDSRFPAWSEQANLANYQEIF